MKKLIMRVEEAAIELAAGMTAKVLVNGANRKPLVINKRAFLLTTALLMGASAANAQGKVAGATSQLAAAAIDIVNYLLPALVIVGICVCVVKAIRQQDFGSYAMGVVAALMAWGGLNAFKDDIFGFFGGSTRLEVR